VAKTCVNHGNVPAATMCHQCHVPVCPSCTTVTPHGSFCSSTCGLRHREFGEKLRSGELRPARGGLALKLFLGLLVVVGGLSVIHFAALRGILPARRIDVIGFLLERAGGLVPGAPR
jgi:hypothetical protein